MNCGQAPAIDAIFIIQSHTKLKLDRTAYPNNDYFVLCKIKQRAEKPKRNNNENMRYNKENMQT